MASWLSQLQASLSTVPLGVHGPVLGALVAGLVLWLFGGRVVKPGFCVVCVAAGSLLGSALVPTVLPGEVLGVPSPYVGMGLGGIVGIAVAIAVYRAVMAAAGGVVFALLGFLATGAYLSHQPGALTPATASAERQPDTRFLEAASEFSKAARENPAAAARTIATLPADQMRQLADSARSEIGDLWQRLPTQSRLTMIAGSLGAAVAGLFVGAMFPRRTAALITSMLGAGVILGCGVWWAHTLQVAWAQRWLDLSPAGWLAAWGATSAVGAAIQLSSARQERAKPKAPDATAPAAPAKA